MSEQKDVRVEVKLRNNLLLTAMEKNGVKSLMKLAHRVGMPEQYKVLTDLAGMKIPAKLENGSWRPIVLEIADLFECMPEDLFSETQQTQKLKKNRANVSVSSVQIQQYLHGSTATNVTPELSFQASELRKAISGALMQLTPREERVLRMRFGFQTGVEMTFDEIAKEVNLSGNRVREIEAKALRKLKNPTRREQLVATGLVGDRDTGFEIDGKLIDAL